jgi:uncharacterized membrane protein YeaQ/YmgE (transglycosylase-associated protein family)
MGFIWTIIIGFAAGVIAKFIMPGNNEPSGFILTTLLGVVGAFVATYLTRKPKAPKELRRETAAQMSAPRPTPCIPGYDGSGAQTRWC